MQRSVNITSLAQSFSFGIGMLSPFTASQIDNINFWFSTLYNLSFTYLVIYLNGKNGVRTRTLVIHEGWSYSSIFLSVEHEVNCFSIAKYFFFDQAFDKDPFSKILSNLMYPFISSQLNNAINYQIIYLFVIYLQIRTNHRIFLNPIMIPTKYIL